MEQRLANAWNMTVNEKKFIESALLSNLRVDGRRPFDYRQLTIRFGREDGSAEVQLGQTHVMGVVTSKLVQPYRDRPNEGALMIYTEFSPMADPSFEAGLPGEFTKELGRIIDRGFRESRAVDTESLCVVPGKWVWAIRVDLHILDNGGNLIDTSNIAALAALMTFRRPECTIGGEDGQEVIVHLPEVNEPLPLIIHHLPIAVSFAFIGDENIVVIDPTHFEEAVMRGRMTATLNTSGEICAIQKAGGEGVLQSVILQCLRIASVKAGDLTSSIKSAVESYSTERSLLKIKRHVPCVSSDVGDVEESDDLPRQHIERLKLTPDECSVSPSIDMEVETQSSEQDKVTSLGVKPKGYVGRPLNWDPYSKGVDSDALKASLASRGRVPSYRIDKPVNERPVDAEENQPIPDKKAPVSANKAAEIGADASGEKSLKDAVKPKHKRKQKISSNAN